MSQAEALTAGPTIPEPLRELLRRIRFFHNPREIWLFGKSGA